MDSGTAGGGGGGGGGTARGNDNSSRAAMIASFHSARPFGAITIAFEKLSITRGVREIRRNIARSID